METLQGKTKYQAEVAFTEMLSGANYDNDDEATIGTNGLGAKASSIFSKKSIIKNDDGKKLITITTKNHLDDITVTTTNSKSPGVGVKMFPDLEYFGISEIDDIHFDVIKERLLHLSISYPGITFRFNGKSLRLKPKDYFDMFATSGAAEVIEFSNVQIAVTHSDSEKFEHFSLVNGAQTKNGGRHVIDITDSIVRPIREKLAKKFKTIKPADVKNHLRVIVIFKEFLNARYDSQTKEVLKNSSAEIKTYLGPDVNDNITKLVKKIQKNDDIMLSITELFTLKEQAKENAELKKLNKKKRIKTEKYLSATKKKKVLFLCEGASAVGGLLPSLGRDEYGYFELRGVPLNAYDSSQAKFRNNKELSELYQVLISEDYEYICTATDADSDGSHIKGLLIGFFQRYLPDIISQGKFGELRTPVQAVITNKKLTRWVYELGADLKLKNQEVGKYFKGLGSWKSKDLAQVVKTDGIENMIRIFDIDDEVIVDDWLSSAKADKRKEYLQNNVFDITGV